MNSGSPSTALPPSPPPSSPPPPRSFPPPPPEAPQAGADSASPPPSTRSWLPADWKPPRISAAAWLATTGAAMLLVAAVVVVASNWQSITPIAQFSGLVAALLAIYFTAEAGRQRFPTTSAALATLAASITAPVGVAAAATIEQPWPVCILVGGVAALVAAELQSRRWSVPTLKAATSIAAGLAATGLAALTPIPVALIGAVLAAVALLLGATKRSIALSVAVGITPALLLLAEANVGTGTLERIGATGTQLAWSTPLAAAIAAAVVGVTALRKNDTLLAIAATCLLGTGIIAGATLNELADPVLWSIPAALLLLALAVAQTRNVFGVLADRATWLVAVPTACAAPLLAFAAAIQQDSINAGLIDPAFAVCSGLSALALAMTAALSARDERRSAWVSPISLAAMTMLVATTLIATNGAFDWFLVATIGSLSVASFALGTSRGVVWHHASAGFATATLALSLGVAEVGFQNGALLLMCAATAATGLAFLNARLGPTDTFAGTLGLTALGMSFGGPDIVVSLSVATVSAQAFMYLLAQRRTSESGLAATVFAAATASLWWTTGTNDAVLEALRPYAADGIDLAIAALAALLLIGGAALRRLQTANSWLAYSPGLGMAIAWLLSSQLEDGTTWATMGALGVGVIATGVGGWRRLGGPLVLGTGTVIATLVISAGSRLSNAPTWTWIAVGGIGLIILAALIERSPKPLVSSSSSNETTSVLNDFRRNFD